jgi:hypothetical protein
VAAAVTARSWFGEGPANMEGQGAHEHRERVGMLFPYSIWSETRRRVVLNGGVDVGFLPAAMAAGVLQAGATEGGGEVVEELLHVDVVLLLPLAAMERLCTGGLMRSRAAVELEVHRRCGGWC